MPKADFTSHGEAVLHIFTSAKRDFTSLRHVKTLHFIASSTVYAVN
jgi:hypothetical protein